MYVEFTTCRKLLSSGGAIVIKLTNSDEFAAVPNNCGVFATSQMTGNLVGLSNSISCTVIGNPGELNQRVVVTGFNDIEELKFNRIGFQITTKSVTMSFTD